MHLITALWSSFFFVVIGEELSKGVIFYLIYNLLT